MAKSKTTKLMRDVDDVRFQIFAEHEQWNYGKYEGAEARKKLRELQQSGRKATMWNTNNNALSNLFRI